MLSKLNFIIILVSNSIIEFWAEGRDWKQFAEEKTLDDQERHLALEIPTSEMDYARRERENTPAKQHQAKAWAIKAQDNLPVNVVINSRLLVCKVEVG
jgi:hypothetical protein